MADFLRDMAMASRVRADQAMRERDLDQLLRLSEDLTAAPRLRLHPAFSVIAEIKASSPAEGALADSDALDRPALANDYAAGGAAAISVLTEPQRFAGQLDHLADVASALGGDGIPAMRKDFLVDEYQVVEARLAGAGGVLLITAMLDDAALVAMLSRSRELGLFVLLECFDKQDVKRASRLLDLPAAQDMAGTGTLLFGINSRDLRTLAVDPERLAKLAGALPSDVVRVAESGLKVPDDAARAADMGYSVALIGTALMKSERPRDALAAFVRAGTGE